MTTRAAGGRVPGTSAQQAPLTPSDVGGYLGRLGLPAPTTASAAALAELLRAHVHQVPFENLLIQLSRPATLRTGETVARIIRGGGGYCLELNGAFGALLTSLGFEVHRHEGRCWVEKPDPPGVDVNHLALTVRCADGSWWLAEVGMSDAVCEPIPLQAGPYSQGPFRYQLKAITNGGVPGWRFHHDPRGSFGGMDFYLTQARTEIIEAAHRRLSTAPESPFTRLFSVGRRNLAGADILRGRVLLRWDEQGRSSKYYDDIEDWLKLLSTEFGLPVRDLSATEIERLWQRVCAAHTAWQATHAEQAQRASQS